MLEDKVYKYIIANNLVRQGDRIIVGVSGGADSTCLLLILYALSEKLGITLKVVHVNHMIRSDANEDADFVASLCRDRGIPFQLEYADIPQITAEAGLTEEEAGRNKRYELFEQIRQQENADSIAVAHNMDDLAETVMLNMFRGSGLHGVAGIRARRDRIIRPLLNTSRADIEAYLSEKEISFRTDSTNLEDDHTRNRIRHHIMTYARSSINSKAAEHIAAAANEIAQADDYIRHQAAFAYIKCKESNGFINPNESMCSMDSLETGRGQGEHESRICLDLEKFAGYPDIIKRNVLLLCMEELTPHRKDITQKHIQMLLDISSSVNGSASCDLPYAITVVRQYGKLFFKVRNTSKELGNCNPDDGENSLDKDSAEGKNESENQKEFPIKIVDEKGEIINIPGIGNVSYRVTAYDKNEEIPSAAYTKWFNYDKIQKPLIFRHRQPGDYIVCNSKTGEHQSIKKYFINEKIPAAERDKMYILADGSHILWIPGYRISSFYYVTDKTSRIIRFQIGEV